MMWLIFGGGTGKEAKSIVITSGDEVAGSSLVGVSGGSEEEFQRLSVHASYYTKSFGGRLYWYVFLPFHHFILGI